MKRPQLLEFIKRMDKNAVAIFAAAPEAVRSNDTNYRYRPDSDMLYLTGFEEPDALIIIAPKREKPFTMFVRPKDKEREIWDGFRHGVDGAVATSAGVAIGARPTSTPVAGLLMMISLLLVSGKIVAWACIL